MTGPLDESRHPANIITDNPGRWLDRGYLGVIRTVCVVIADDGKTWLVETDEDDVEPGDDPANIRLAIVTADNEAFQIDLPAEVLRELARRINDL